jgi:ubiquitin-conjugating enzyme E2 Q
VVDICGVTLYLSSVVLHSAMSSSGVKTGAILESDVAGTSSSTPTPAVTPPLSRLMPVTMAIYNRNFDDLADSEKCQEMVQLIDTLPSIREMSRYLKQQQTPNIRVWGDRISPAALGLLRWIIASNRSSIVQVDFCPGQEGDQGLKSLVRHGERVSNMDGWVQFRFAQGAPDKEQRFRKALENTVAIRNPAYPTLFAWHGSPVHNWHSIIRTGLDFKETIHGRAYGHGCYHSLDHSTSLAYGVSDRRVSTMTQSLKDTPAKTQKGSARQKAMFKVEQAMCLNEIVNAPKAFTSTTPHLVVQHVDWIQCRYLFVKTESDNNMLSNGNDALTEAMEADKSR